MIIETIVSNISNLSLIKKVNEIINYINTSGGLGTPESLDKLVQYDNSDKSTITLEGSDGTKITNLQNGDLSQSSTDAVTGGQVYDFVTKEIEEHTGSLYTLTKEGNMIVLTDKDGTRQEVEDSDTTYETATTDKDGLYPASDKQMLLKHEEMLQSLVSSEDTFVAVTEEEIDEIVAG